MASNPSGKTIKQIKLLKNKVKITFDNNSILEISKDTYTGFYLYEGKHLTNQEIKKLKETDDLNVYLSYAISVCTKTLMSEQTLKDKVYKKGAHKDTVEKVLKILKKNDLINDKGYIEDYLEYSKEKLIGEKKIRQDLINKGISIEDANKIKFNHANELAKAKKLVKQLELRYKNNAYETRKSKIYATLLTRGFNYDVASHAILSIKKDANDKLLEKEIKTTTSRWMRANEHKYEDEKLRFNAFYTYMRRKGYTSEKIKKAWGEYYEFIY